MAVNYTPANAPTEKHVRRNSFEFRAIYFMCFAVFLIAAIAERLLPWNWQAQPQTSVRRRSIIEQVREAAGTCTAYAFMG
jgi:hypothetical protein